MATTSPDNIWTPDAGDDYALTTDLAATADTVQDALNRVGYRAGLLANRPVFGNEGHRYYATDTDLTYFDTGAAWVTESRGPLFQEAFTWSRANVDNTAQYPQLVDDPGSTTDNTLASFQRVSGTDPDGVGGLKFPVPGVYHISVGMNLAVAAGARSFIQIGSDSDQFRQRSTIPAGEDQLTVNQTLRTTAVDQVVPIWFYKSNGNLGVNSGRVVVRRFA